MNDKLEFVTSREDAGQRLDVILAHCLQRSRTACAASRWARTNSSSSPSNESSWGPACAPCVASSGRLTAWARRRGRTSPWAARAMIRCTFRVWSRITAKPMSPNASSSIRTHRASTPAPPPPSEGGSPSVRQPSPEASSTSSQSTRARASASHSRSAARGRSRSTAKRRARARSSRSSGPSPKWGAAGSLKA